MNPAQAKDELFTLYSVPSHATLKPEICRGREIGSAKQVVAPDTVLLCKINPRINRVWRVGSHQAGTRIVASTEWLTFPPNPVVIPDYLRLFLMQDGVRSYLAANAAGVGGSLMRVNGSDIAGLNLPLAPKTEQERIVSAVTALFEEVEAGEAALARARGALTTFRASLLHAAVTGQLTEAWRAGNPPTEDGPALLRRILAERRAAWERAAHARLVAKGRPPTTRSTPPYVTPKDVDAARLPTLAAGWTWATLDQLISEPPRNGVSVQGQPHPPGTPALRLDALGDEGLRYDRRRYIEIPAAKAAGIHIAAGDFLVSRANGSPALVAKGSIAQDPPEAIIFPDTMIRLRFASVDLAAWVNLAWKGDGVRSQILQKAKTSAGILKVSQEDLLAVILPVPPSKERVAVIASATALLEDGGTGRLSGLDGDAGSLRQSILHAAFTGRLVPQDPSDEPASALLARLRARPAAPRRTRRRTPEATPA